MTTNSAVNLEIINAADGVEISGGTVKRTLKWLGADVTITGSGEATHTFPTTSSVLARTDIGQTFLGSNGFSAVNSLPLSILGTYDNGAVGNNLINAYWNKTIRVAYASLSRLLNFVAILDGDQGGGTGTQALEGIVADTQYACSDGNMLSIIAMRAIPRNVSGLTATLGTLRGLQVSPVLNANYGLVSIYYGIEIAVVGAGNVTTAAGLKILNQCGSGVTNGYGIYINSQAGASTLNYSIYSAGGKMYHAGDVEIGGNLTLSSCNIITDTTIGMKIGTATTQKLGFYNVTPVVQRAAAAQAAAPAGGTGATAGAYDTAAHRDSLIALVNEIRTVLVNLGLMKGAA